MTNGYVYNWAKNAIHRFKCARYDENLCLGKKPCLGCAMFIVQLRLLPGWLRNLKGDSNKWQCHC